MKPIELIQKIYGASLLKETHPEFSNGLMPLRKSHLRYDPHENCALSILQYYWENLLLNVEREIPNLNYYTRRLGGTRLSELGALKLDNIRFFYMKETDGENDPKQISLVLGVFLGILRGSVEFFPNGEESLDYLKVLYEWIRFSNTSLNYLTFQIQNHESQFMGLLHQMTIEHYNLGYKQKITDIIHDYLKSANRIY